MHKPIASGLLAAALLAGGCASPLVNVNLNVVGEQTALEKQVLGAYRSLGEDLMVYSSVRGVDESGALKVPPAATDSQRAACAAMRNRDYNRDDIRKLLRAGAAAEGNDGFLIVRKEFGDGPAGALTHDQILKLADEENTDRKAILKRLMETTPNLAEDQRGKVGKIFAGLNRESAPGGAWIQDDDGAWRRQ